MIRRDKSGRGVFVFAKNGTTWQMQNLANSRSRNDLNNTINMNGQCYEFWHSQYEDLRIIDLRGKLYYCLHDVARIFGKSAASLFSTIANSEGEVKEFSLVVANGCVFADGEVAPVIAESKDKVKVWVAFVDATLLKDIEANPTNQQRLVSKWIHGHVQRMLDVPRMAEQCECDGVFECYDTDFSKAVDIRLTEEGLVINEVKIV